MRRFLVFSLIVLAIVGIAGFVGYRYVCSSVIPKKIVAKLESVYGGSVRVANVDVGLDNSSLHGFELLEEGSDQVWLKIQSLDADVSIWDMVAGEAMPNRVALKGPTVVLRFDRAGNLITRFPVQPTLLEAEPIKLESMPQIDIEGGELIFRKEGQPDLVAKNVKARFNRKDGHLFLSGACENAELGKLSVEGVIDDDKGTLRLKNELKAHITSSFLERLPFVPASVWEEVQISEGDTTAQLTLSIDVKSRAMQYRVDLAPEKMKLVIPAIELSARNASGLITIENHMVQLRNVQGEAFGGIVRTEADLDFSGPLSKLKFNKIDVENLSVRELPLAWEIPALVRKTAPNGRLFGHASLSVKISNDGKVDTRSEGKAEVRDPTVSPEPIEFDWRLNPKRQIKTPAKSPPQKTSVAPIGIENLLAALLVGQTSLSVQEGKTPDYIDLSFKLKDVNLAEFIKNLEVKLPFVVEGKLSLQIKASLPNDQLRDLKAYRFEGSAQVTGFRIADVRMEEASAEVDYADGLLSLTSLKGRFSPEAASADKALAGAFAGSGQLQLFPLGELKADLAVERLPLHQLLSVGLEAIPIQGTISGKVAAQVRTDKLPDLESLEVTGAFATDSLVAYGLKLEKGSFALELKNNNLDLRDLNISLYGGEVRGSAVIPLDPTLAGKADVRFSKLDAKTLTKDLAVPFSIEGKVDGTLKGTLAGAAGDKARTASLTLDLEAPKLRVQKIPTEQLHGVFVYKSGALDYKLVGKSLGGAFELEGKIPSQGGAKEPKKESNKGHLRIQGVRLGRLVKALNLHNAVPLKGLVSLELNFTQDSLDQEPVGRGTVRLSDVRWKDAVFANNLEGDIILSKGELRLRDLSGTVGPGRFSSQIAFNHRNPDRSWISLNLDNVEASQFLGPWIGDTVEGSLQARIRGTLGSEWRGTADFELARGKVFGLEVLQWRLPVAWTFAPTQNRGQIEVHETSAQVARGRVTGKASLAWETTARIEGSLRFANVDLKDFLRQTFGPSQLGGGQMSGRFDFAGRDVRSVDDLTGNLTASFKQAQALQLPVLRQVSPYLGIGPTTTFQNGDLQARLDRGKLRIQQLSLSGGTIQLFVDGTVSLDGRLNLAVVTKTGDLGLAPDRLRLLGLRVPVAGPVPLLVLQEASTLLSARLISLQVTGTFRSPVIQVRPLPIIAQEALRFFLNRANIPAAFGP